MTKYNKEVETIDQLLADPQMPTTDKVLTIMYHNMRQQIFGDGNFKCQ